MRRKDHTAFSVGNIFLQKLQNLCPHHRIQPIRRFIQHKQLRIPGKHWGKHQLYLHSPWKLFQLKLLIQFPSFRQFVEFLRRKGRIEISHHSADIPDPEIVREIELISYIADVLLVMNLILHACYPVHINLSAVAFTDICDQIQRGALACTVLSHIAHDISFRERETDILQTECLIIFRKIAYFQ